MATRNFRSRFPSRAVGGVRRKSLWLGSAPAEATLTATGGTIFFSLNASALALRPFTIVRTILSCYIRSDQEATEEIQSCGIGCVVVSDQAVAIGVTAVPTPITDINSDLWFAYGQLTSASRGGAGSGVVGAPLLIESRAMRKVEEGDDVVTVAELSGVSNGFKVVIGGRQLVKLH